MPNFGDKIDVTVKGLEPVDNLATALNNISSLFEGLTFEYFILGTAAFCLTVSLSFYGGKAIVDGLRWLVTSVKKSR